jgi:peptide deformylase
MYLKFSELPKAKLDKIVYADKITKPAGWIAELPKTFAEFNERTDKDGITASPALVNQCERMVRAAFLLDGVGVSANQIGINKRMFAIRENSVTDEFRVYIHPSYSIDSQAVMELASEGCLSVPDTKVVVKRPNAILAEWFEFTKENKLQHRQELLIGLRARVYMHESDHLNARSIIDYAANRDTKRSILASLAKKK